MIAVAVAAGLFVFFWSQKPQMMPLYTGLDTKATAEATDLLRTAQIPFELNAATGAISVPENKRDPARCTSPQHAPTPTLPFATRLAACQTRV